MRYARPEFLNAIAEDTPLPMIVDAELGMPLDLGQWECLWEEDADDLGTPYVSPSLFALDLHICIEALNPDPENLPKLDPKDAFLLGDPSSSSAPYINGASSSSPSTPLAHVPWLRKTEYISREGVQRSQAVQETCVLSVVSHISTLNLPAENSAWHQPSTCPAMPN
jgi:RNA polymerase II-associated factor 1